MDSDETRAARAARAEARRLTMTGEVVPLGAPKQSPYVHCTPEERIAAALRLMEHHAAIRGTRPSLPRSQWPGEVFVSETGSG